MALGLQLSNPVAKLRSGLEKAARRRRRPANQPQQHRRLTPAELVQLVEARLAGDTVAALAEQFVINRTTVIAHMRREAVPKRDPVLHADKLQHAIRLYESGVSTLAIAQQLGLRPSTVWAALRRAGVQLRRRNGWHIEATPPN